MVLNLKNGKTLLFEYQNTRMTFYAPLNREPEHLVFMIRIFRYRHQVFTQVS